MWIFASVVTLTFTIFYIVFKRLNQSWLGMPLHVDSQAYERAYENRKGVFADKLTLGVKFESNVAFVLKPESMIDIIAKTFGIAKEFTTGDERFDDEVYIASESHELHGLLVSDHALRELILELITLDHDSAILKRIESGKGRLWVQYSVGHPRDSEAARVFSERLARQLACLKQALAPMADAAICRSRFPFKATVCLGVSAAILLHGLLMGFRVSIDPLPLLVSSKELLSDSFKVTAVLCALAIIGAGWFLKRSSRTALVFADIVTVGLVGIWLNTMVWLFDINHRFDVSERHHYMADVLAKGKSTSKFRRYRGYGGYGRTTYYVEWYQSGYAGKKIRMRLNEEQYDQIRVGAPISVAEAEGYLGYRFIDTVDIDP